MYSTDLRTFPLRTLPVSYGPSLYGPSPSATDPPRRQVPGARPEVSTGAPSGLLDVQVRQVVLV
jgi:hypothetical protein